MARISGGLGRAGQPGPKIYNPDLDWAFCKVFLSFKLSKERYLKVRRLILLKLISIEDHTV